MGVFDKLKAKFKDDWCEHCAKPMNLRKKQLLMLPNLTVGHYVSHDDPNYYLQNAVKVNRKADIPSGVYACGSYLYHCNGCGRDVVKLVVFLPVRDEEQVEEAFLYEDPELVKFIKSA